MMCKMGSSFNMAGSGGNAMSLAATGAGTVLDGRAAPERDMHRWTVMMRTRGGRAGMGARTGAAGANRGFQQRKRKRGSCRCVRPCNE